MEEADKNEQSENAKVSADGHGPVWKVDTIPQLDGLSDNETMEDCVVAEDEYPEFIEQIRSFDLNEDKDIQETERDFNKLFIDNNIKIKHKKITMNYNNCKSILFSVEPFKSDTIFEIEEQLQKTNPKFSISFEF